MKIRNQGAVEKIEPQMAPMIDVVFLLLIFFMLTLKIIQPEGDFNINMPAVAQAQVEQPKMLPDFKVRLIADPATGDLLEIRFGQGSLGSGPAAFKLLQRMVEETFRDTAFADEVEVEIDADFDLSHEHMISAVSACTGKVERGKDGELKIRRFVQKIKFAPPRQSAR